MATKTKTTKKAAPKYVVVRTYSAGVHCGELGARAGEEVEIKNCRRIWSWKGRYTLNEVANHGVGAGSNVSEPVDSNILTGAIEILSCSAEAEANLRAAKWGT